MRTARSITSGENFGDFLMWLHSQSKEPPQIPGRFNFFSRELETEAQHFIDAGYVQAWVSVLLGRSLNQNWNRPLPNELAVREVGNDQDMERYASLPGISNQGATRDPCIHNFFATAGGEVAAKGQLVLLPGSGAYISDMFSKPEYRLRGLCTTILAALERKALSLGATHVCLAPGYQVAAFGLYEKYGYTAVGSRAVLILSERNASAA
jgi:GNAT superfamily N-acetyltransferase